MLFGRDAEIAAIGELLDGARAGRSGVLVVRGEAGIGKTALLAHAREAATGMRVLHGAGSEAEQTLPYAALHLLFGAHLDRADALPGPQAAALRAAFGGGTAPGDRFLVGLAVLTLLSDLAEERPLLVLVDDANRLDGPSAQALLFAARRLAAEPVALLLAARTADAPDFAAPGLPETTLGPLGDADAAALLAARTDRAPAGHHAISEARGNPLALLRPSTSDYERIERGYAGRLAELPAATRLLLAAAASDDLGDLGTVLAAVRPLGAGAADLEPAERAGLVRSGAGRIEFRHPLLRTTAYRDAPVADRLAAHRRLAAVYAARGDACHHAWHAAHATTGPDEEAAAALETAGMHEAAAERSPDPRDRGRRLLAAARAAADGGRHAAAAALADRAAPDVDGPAPRAELALLRASLADEQDRTREAHRLLLDSALETAPHDAALAGRLLFESAAAAANAGDAGELARVAGHAERLGVPDAPLVRALADVFAGQRPLVGDGGMPALRRLLDAMGARDEPRDRVRRALWHVMAGDAAGARDLASSLAAGFRRDGRAGLLAPALMVLARAELVLGRPREALAAGTEGLRIAADTGQHRIRVYLATVLALLAAQRGDEAACAEHTAEALARDVAPGTAHATGALALLDLGLGRHDAALDRLAALFGRPHAQGGAASLPDLVEAAVRAGRPEEGRGAAAWLAAWAERAGRPWVEAVALRSAALLDPSDDLYTRAIELHRRDPVPFEQARTELLYGEWLRRERRRSDARARLRAALETFERLGAVPWAERARAELRATGESAGAAPAPAADLASRLTPQELQVVRMAAAGLTNRDIGAQLFLSPRTVGYHLYKAYPKLGVSSRGELAALAL
ncbi:helix-turn-helix transcriptional regulator [Actinomadura parmotrematis]|uniref:AAA family ATPase n=1 Tax=Actinomadura parmotrematis TaxID=2864039 RepID=A0ABS7FTL5_9ACTN|nr:helix-turn-helix transcriptional regulator [Actinomadura parmotrematis]MBW8483084.1 AAA family ATPase [Actinomadura parmotrematis]